MFFQQHALQILEKVDAAIDSTRHMARSQRAMFGIVFVASVFYGQLPLLVRALRQKDNAELALVELATVQQIQALKAGRIDIGCLRIDDPAWSRECFSTNL